MRFDDLRWSCGGGRTVLLTGVIAAMTAVAGAAPPSGVSSGADMLDVRDALKLTGATLVEVDVDPTAMPGPVVTAVPIGGRLLTLELQPHSVRSPDYAVFAVDADGAMTPVDPAPIRTLRGGVREIPGAVVSGSLLEDGLYVSVQFPGAGRYWIEPVARILPNAPASRHVVYHDDDMAPTNARCGMGREALGHIADDSLAGGIVADGDQFAYGTTPCIADLAVDADFAYYQDWFSSTSSVQSRINGVINTVNTQYENQCGITHQIATILIRTSQIYTSNNGNTLLSQFRSQWLNNHSDITRDLAHLFTGREIDGSTLGIAWNIGAICTNGAYCFGQSDWAGFGCATDLSAHEMGHLWGAFHCPGFCDNTMNSGITCANDFNSTSITSIVNHRNSRTCLDCEPVTDYCSAGSNNTSDEFIESVNVGSISNSSGRSSYTNYTSQSTDMERNESYAITVVNGESYPGDQCKVWVDWNQDLDFTDSGEEFVLGSGPATFNGSIDVPAFAALGDTRMRVRINYEDTSTSCGNVTWGEVEDYTITVITPVSNYCAAGSDDINDEYIERVQFGAIDNSSGRSSYTDYTLQFTQVERGETYAMTVNNGDAFAGDQGTAWIDWNGDSDFSDSGEQITLGGGPAVFSSSITVPLSATNGTTQLRVRVNFTDTPVACGNTSFGEVEDYALVIIDPLPDQGACCLPNDTCFLATPTNCSALSGTYQGDDTDCTACSPPDCPADVDGSGDVGFSDLTQLLAAWGACGSCPEDINGDGDVGFSDLTALLAAWGPC